MLRLSCSQTTFKKRLFGTLSEVENKVAYQDVQREKKEEEMTY